LSQTYEQVIELSQNEMLDFSSRSEQRLRELEEQYKVRIVPRGNVIKVLGEQAVVDEVVGFIRDLVKFSKGKQSMNRHQMRAAMEGIRTEGREEMERVYADRVQVPLHRRTVNPMTGNQKRYLDAIRHHDIVFGIGPAGTGKTYLAMAMAVHSLMANEVGRIVLVRPAVEAGEKLGFLPGDITAKFDPYVRPLYDALHDMMEPERVKMLLENNVVEVAPLAFMRGRTLNSSFVILDEGQNTTIEQMKMFLTRLGYDSKAVITGDVTQMDLPQGRESGLVHVSRILKDVKGIEFISFEQKDVVRHELVQRIIRAYDAAEHPAVKQEELPLPDVSDSGDAAGEQPMNNLETEA
jgi:phosphate starvation-inducible PhoH-like protein